MILVRRWESSFSDVRQMKRRFPAVIMLKNICSKIHQMERQSPDRVDLNVEKQTLIIRFFHFENWYETKNLRFMVPGCTLVILKFAWPRFMLASSRMSEVDRSLFSKRSEMIHLIFIMDLIKMGFKLTIMMADTRFLINFPIRYLIVQKTRLNLETTVITFMVHY